MLIEKFEEQVKRNPKKTALKGESKTLSYEELNSYSNTIALEIKRISPPREKGGEGNHRVTLLFDHGVEMITAILAVLKAGYIYITLSTDYPERRHSYVIADSGASLIVTDAKNMAVAAKLARENNIEALDIDTLDKTAETQNPEREITHDDIAYIMYTSGSTGKPKGVVQTHRNVNHFTEKWIRHFSITETDRMILLASFCHDASVQDMYSALHAGATLYPYDMRRRERSVELSEFLIAEKITIWHSVASLFSFFANRLTGTEEFTLLRNIIIGGEAVREHENKMFQKYFPHSVLGIIYGQTESSVNSIRLINPGEEFEKPYIGEPLDETTIFLLNEDGDEVDPLQIGEILVAGPYSSTGYWKNPEASEKTFSDDDEFGRIFWTGDLGRLMLDGKIEFVGRKDHQVKIRGFRIELGEIETQLLEDENVDEAVVLVKEYTVGNNNSEDGGEKYLCAYFVAAGEVDTSKLREKLLNQLPDYMVPSYFIPMERFPLTTSGKVDRKTFPEPETLGTVEYIAPRNGIEQKLVEIWSDVLEMEEKIIGIDSNFFQLGGHSLKAAAMVPLIHKTLNVKISLMSLFKTVTIREIAEKIAIEKRNTYHALERTEKKEYYPLTSTQRTPFLGLKKIGEASIHHNISSVYIIEGKLDFEKFDASIKIIVQRHETLRTSFLLLNGKVVQRINEKPFTVTYTQCTEEEARIRKKTFIRPFDLSVAPLIRVECLTVMKGKYYVLIDMHHVISDAASVTILIDEFFALYVGAKLEPLPFQFKDYAAWQHEQLEGPLFEEQEQYWLKKMDGFLYTQLPYDQAPTENVMLCDNRTLTIETHRFKSIDEYCKRNNVTRFTFLMAVLHILLAAETGQNDTTVGVRIASRQQEELKALIGMLINKVFIRGIIEKGETFSQHLEKVNQTIGGALDNSIYPYELLAAKLAEKKETAELLSILVNYMPPVQEEQNPESTTEQPEALLKINTQKTDEMRSRYDIDLIIVDGNNRVILNFYYKKGIYKKERIKKMIDKFETIINRVLENDNQLTDKLI